LPPALRTGSLQLVASKLSVEKPEQCGTGRLEARRDFLNAAVGGGDKNGRSELLRQGRRR
jgi:hypothetical protein